jgi:hypothetical protein
MQFVPGIDTAAGRCRLQEERRHNDRCPSGMTEGEKAALDKSDVT